MNNNTTIKIAVAAALVAVAAYPKLSQNATLTMLSERYPDIDPKVAKMAYKSIMRDSLRGKLDCSNWSEERFNSLFLLRAKTIKIQSK